MAWLVAYNLAEGRDADVARVVYRTLGPLWILLAGLLLLRVGSALLVRREVGVLERLDILTGRGRALAWTSAAAVVFAVCLGYASLAVVGMLGTALFHVVAILSLIAFRGPDPMRASHVFRRFSTDAATEGDPLVEELRFAGVRVPVGFRLFVTGRIGPRWATVRHVLSSEESGAEIVVESDVGPAVRGEHQPEPLQAWLEDTFGLFRSTRVDIHGPVVAVGPRHLPVDHAPVLLDQGVGPRAPRAGVRLPTEGSFDLREYKAGDDIRRIHWVRSMVAGELVVRMPDEIPPDRPRVRLVLDTYFPAGQSFDSDAPAQMLDALVSVWLGVGRALVEAGVRVTIVAAIPPSRAGHEGDGESADLRAIGPRRVSTVRHVLSARNAAAAQKIGAQIAWQAEIPVGELLTRENTLVVARGVLGPRPEGCPARWIVVTPTLPDPDLPWPSDVRFPHPMGSAENRWSHRSRLAEELAVARTDHVHALLAMRVDAQPPPGSFRALPTDHAVRLEAIR